MVCANGTTCRSLGIIQLQLKIGNRAISHPFHVMKDLPVRIFIGADLMKTYGIVLDLQGSKFWFKDEPGTTFPVHGMMKDKPLIYLTIGSDEDPEREKIVKKVQEILDDFPDVARKDGKYGRTSITHHTIRAYGKPIKQKVRRISPAMRKIVRAQIDQLLQDGLIRETTSPWASPIVMIKKKASPGSPETYRLCIDYIKLNSQIEGDASPMENVSELLKSIPANSWYTVFDLRSSYYQIPLDEESIPKAAFCTTEGSFEPVVLFFGLKDAPKTFSKLMRVVLKNYEGFTVVYIDDICIFSGTLEEHLQHIKLVLARLRQAGLTINLEKCHFCKRSVVFLGHEVGASGIRRLPETVRAITEFPTPRTRRDVQSFLGLCQWYASFIPDFALKAKGMYAVTSKNVSFTWGPEQEDSFQQLKHAMCNQVTLHSIDYRHPLIMKCDASEHGMGGVLVQVVDGKERPIQFVSKLFKKAERNYHIFDKEATAILYCYRKFRPYLENHKFTIVTDNRCVAYIKSMKDRKPRIQRMAIEISSWDCDIVLRPGKDNVEADVMSRNAVPPEPGEKSDFEDVEDYKFLPIASIMDVTITKEEVRREQEKDEYCQRIMKEILAVNCDRKSLFQIFDGILMRKIILEVKLPLVDLDAEASGLQGETEVTEFKFGPVGVCISPCSDPHQEMIEELVLQHTSKRVTGCTNVLPSQDVHADKSPIIIASAKPKKKTKTDRAQKKAPKDSTNVISAKSLAKKIARQYKWVPVIPVSLRKKVLYIFHDSPFSGHLSVTSTLQRIKSRMYWDGVNSDVRKYCRECDVCQRSKAPNAKPYGKMMSAEPPSQSHQTVYCDLVGPLVKTGGGRLNEYILVCVCALSKWVHFLPLRKATASKIKELLINWVFTKNGFPSKLITDNGSQFVSDLFKNFCESMNIEHETSSPYHQQSNLAERYIKILKSMLQAYTEESQTAWDENLQALAMAINTSVNSSTGLTPADIHLGRQLPFAFDREFSHLERLDPATRKEEIRMLPEKIRKAVIFARENIKKSQEANKELYDKKRRDHDFKTGDKVLIKNHELSNKSKKKTQKLMKRFIGPFELGEAKNDLTFEILTIPDRKSHGFRHVSEMKHFVSREEEPNSPSFPQN